MCAMMRHRPTAKGDQMSNDNSTLITFDEYQRQMRRTAPPNTDDRLILSALGLAGEVGEFVEMVKKKRFHGHRLDISDAEKKLGDVLWYLACAAEACGLDLDGIAEANIAKLER